MSQNHISNSISVSAIVSHDDFDRPHNQIVNLNYYTLEVRRPDESNILQFLEHQYECSIYYFITTSQDEMATFAKNEPHIQIEAVQPKPPPSSSSEEQQLHLMHSQHKQSSEQQIQVESPINDDLPLEKSESKPKFKQSLNSLSPTRKQRKTQIARFSALVITCSNRMKIIKKFVDIMKTVSPFKPARMLAHNQEILINDKSSHASCKAKTSFLESFTQNHIDQKATLFRLVLESTINPQSTFAFIWEATTLFLTLYLLFQFSIQICFAQPVKSYIFSNSHALFIFQDLPTLLQTLTALFFAADIVFGFKKGFYRAGLPVRSAAKVANHYLRNYFLYDALSLIPLLVNLVAEETLFLRLLNSLLLLKLSQLKHAIAGLEGRLHQSPGFLIGYRFFNVLGMVFVFAHVFGCLWHVVGSGGADHTWIKQMQLSYEEWYVRYTYSIYWSVMTMSTVGYGDVTAQNVWEMLFSIFTMLFASIVFAYSLNTIGLILDQVTRTRRQLDENFAVINRYMQRKSLQPSLQFRVRKFLQSLWAEQNELRQEDEQKLLRQLSSQLQEEISISLYGKFLSNVPLFRKYFSKGLLVELAKQIEEFNVGKNSYITETGSLDALGLYFFLSGDADVLIELNGKKNPVSKLKVGSINYYC